jgi:hypothetical protein
MAYRLCFDIGLHLDCDNEDIPEREKEIRNMTLFACVIYDKYVSHLCSEIPSHEVSTNRA